MSESKLALERRIEDLERENMILKTQVETLRRERNMALNKPIFKQFFMGLVDDGQLENDH